MIFLRNYKFRILIFFSGGLIFLPFLGSVHLFDWDEINFAECAREMIVSNNYTVPTINYQPFCEKPPLFIWMQAASMNIFGINEFAARLPNAVCGIITLLVLFMIGRKVKNPDFGLLWVLIYAGSFLPHFYFKSGIIDPWFNLFIFSGIYFFVLHTYEKKYAITSERSVRNIFLSAFFIGLGILTKGPVAFLIYLICIVIYWVLNYFRKIFSLRQAALGAITIFTVGGWWFLFECFNNFAFINHFVNYQLRLFSTEDAGHGGPFYYHPVVLLLGCFPASVFAIAGFKMNIHDTSFQSHFKKWMIILLMVVLILFSVVKTKIVHYSSLAWFPLTYIAVYSIEKIINGEFKWRQWMTWLTGIIGLMMGFIFLAIPIADRYKQEIISSELIKDEYAVENLRATVHWSGYEGLPGAFYIAGIIIVLLLVRNRYYKKAILSLFVLSLLTINLVSILIVPKIEKYTQSAAVEFYENLQGKDCYVETLGFKSYAYLFYSGKNPQCNINHCDANWLLTGDIDKPAFFVVKINDEKEYEQNYPALKELYKKHGFVFYERQNPKHNYKN